MGGGREGAARGTWNSSASKAMLMSILILSKSCLPLSATAGPTAKMKKPAESDLSLDWDFSFSFTSRCQFNSRALTPYFLMIISPRKRRKSLLGKAAVMSATSSETYTVGTYWHNFSLIPSWLISDLQAVLKNHTLEGSWDREKSHLPVDW